MNEIFLFAEFGAIIIAIGASIVLFCAVVLLFPETEKRNLKIVSLVVGLVIVIGGCYTNAYFDQPRLTNAIHQIEPEREQLSQTQFFLKEMGQGELIKGDVSGRFFLASGGIYGTIDQNQVISVIYYDTDTVLDDRIDVYRAIAFNLEQVEIVTIGEGELPYFRYDNCYIECVRGEDMFRGTVVRIETEYPRFYLPDGWQIIGENTHYGG